MANSGRFPKPYIDSIPNPETVSGIEYVNFRTMDIGARKGSIPTVSNGPKRLDHVGTSASGKGK